jgi:DNA-binding MarR family transcriptional regulator
LQRFNNKRGRPIVNLVNDLTTAISADPTTIANRLRPALLRLNRELRREIHSLGVTGGQVSLLIKIQKEPGIGIRELARWERMSKPGMSKYVARLETAGLVHRTELADRRRVGLELTSDGSRVLSSVKRRRTAWLAGRLRGLSPSELDAVDAAVDPLLKLLEVEP